MEQRKYEILKKISIEDSEIIKCQINDIVYKFCVLNNIDNLADFIEIYYNQRPFMDSRYNFYYFDGIIDMINLIFFKEKLPEGKLLSRQISIYQNKERSTRFAYIKEDDGFNIGCSDNKSLKRLGFNTNEIKIILKYSLVLGKELSIIAFIKSYLESFNFEKMSKNDEIFITKLHVLSEYYDKNKDQIENINSYNYYKAQEDIKKIKDLYLRIDVLKEEIKKISNDFKDKISNFPQEDKNVKRLIRDFHQTHCK